MKKIFLALVILGFLFACKKESETVTPHSVKIINNSSQNIKLLEYNDTSIISIDSNEIFNFTYTVTGNSTKTTGLFPEFGDSAKITYNDTLNVYHGCKRYNVLRDIRNSAYYTHIATSVSDTHYYTYTLTNVDFIEAQTISDTL